MIVALVDGAIAYIVVRSFGASSGVALFVAILFFLCTLPFAMFFGAIGRKEDRDEERNEALREICRKVGRTKRFSSNTPNLSQVPKHTVRDDRVVIVDNRQVNIYNGTKPKEK